MKSRRRNAASERLSTLIEGLRGRLLPERASWLTELADQAESELALDGIYEDLDADRVVLSAEEEWQLFDLAVGFSIDLQERAKSLKHRSVRLRSRTAG